MKRALLCLGVCLAAGASGALQAQTLGKITVVVEGIAEGSGKLMVALEKNAANFDDGPLEASVYRGQTVDVARDGSVTVVFEDVPFGVYAVKTFYDANGNGKLDTNMFGVPKEQFGFSNNATGTFGPASFADASFKLDQTTQLLRVNLQ